MKNILIATAMLLALVSCPVSKKGEGNVKGNFAELRDSLEALIQVVPGVVGIALVTDEDTLTINNEEAYPLMSVFKMHQAIAVAHKLELEGRSLEAGLWVNIDSLNPDTWSPMLKDYKAGKHKIPVRQLLNYSVTHSDNNASNLLFKHIAGTAETDSFIKSIAPDTTFSILFTEEEMSRSHDLSYKNSSSPLSCALLLKQIFEQSVVSESSLKIIRNALISTTTGNNRIAAPLQSVEGSRVAHKTGSGYRTPDGLLTAFNDIAYVILPDGRNYTLAFMIKDFNGSEKQAAGLMAEISGMILKNIKILVD